MASKATAVPLGYTPKFRTQSQARTGRCGLEGRSFILLTDLGIKKFLCLHTGTKFYLEHNAQTKTKELLVFLFVLFVFLRSSYFYL